MSGRDPGLLCDAEGVAGDAEGVAGDAEGVAGDADDAGVVSPVSAMLMLMMLKVQLVSVFVLKAPTQGVLLVMLVMLMMLGPDVSFTKKGYGLCAESWLLAKLYCCCFDMRPLAVTCGKWPLAARVAASGQHQNDALAHALVLFGTPPKLLCGNPGHLVPEAYRSFSVAIFYPLAR